MNDNLKMVLDHPLSLLIAMLLILTSTIAFAADNKLIGTDKDGNDIYLLSEPKEVVPGIINMIVQYSFRIKEKAHNPVSPVKGMHGYQVYVDRAEHSIIVDCNGLKRVTVLDSRLYNNIGKEIETYRPDFNQVGKFRINGEKIITDYFCR